MKLPFYSYGSCTTISITDLVRVSMGNKIMKLLAYRRFIELPDSTSVSVKVSIVCTPGVSAIKFTRTDWQVEGRSGLMAF